MTASIATITLDDARILRRAPHVEAERQTAIRDLLAANAFAPADCPPGPYDIFISTRENRLLLRITCAGLPVGQDVQLPLKPFQRIIKDYFLICESYYDAVSTHNPYKVEALDMSRRGIHNEGSELLQSQLEGKIALDFDTARRLFTLICVLHIK